MLSQISYIYDAGGHVTYAVVPIHIWEELQRNLQNTTEVAAPVFDPLQYEGCLSLDDMDIEQELLQIRQEWNRDF